MTDQERNNTPERKAYMKAYAEANREKIREHKRRYAEANPEKVDGSQAAYREANREKIRSAYQASRGRTREHQKAYYLANRERLRAKQKVYREANKDRINMVQQARRYGVTSEVIVGMAEAQDNRCAICRTPLALVRLNVDHCHASGAVRGILCSECNRGLSCFKDNPRSLRRAIKYLADFGARRG